MNRRSVLAGGLALPIACAAQPEQGENELGLTADGKADDYPRLQRVVDRTAERGGIVTLPAGTIRLSRPLRMRSGVSLVGAGRHYEVARLGNRFTGTWVSGAPIELHSVQNCAIRDIGINCGERPDTIGISIGSDNKPASKSHVIERVSIFGAALGVRWGLSNRLATLEQCDDITFRDIAFHSCVDGFRLDAANGSDFSRIERVTFDALRSIGFDLRSAGFLTIENCAAGTLANATMFRITGNSPDPLRIVGCQSEPLGRFLAAEGPNDQATILLEGNVINRPIEANGILRIVSRANYLNSTIALDGLVRWRSYDDVWDAPGARHVPQVRNGARFVASIFRDAGASFGRYLQAGTRIEEDTNVIEVVTRSGVYSPPFARGGTFAVGDYFEAGGQAYRVQTPGVAGLQLSDLRSGQIVVERIGNAAITRRIPLT